ncbi:MAG: thrombospondin type 3 repeat-containing protein [Bacteriovoracaceae bacterium]|jgi:hypothetical protein|nr:thrombospondin type 3 repeat-containing protein [Bacteriovoracaceae bacterium]
MKKLILLSLLLTTASCSFKSEKSSKKKTEKLEAAHIRTLDSDGDGVSDYDEMENGTDPYVADVPQVEAKFLQNYKIKIDYEDDTSFEMDTTIRRDDQDFKYRVGRVYLRENSHDKAAQIGRINSVSWGNIKQEDLSWVKYPEIDKEFYFNSSREYRTHEDKVIRESSISLENTLKLAEYPVFDTIEDVELSFYYYSHEKEKHILLHTEKIDQVFQSGTRETVDVVIHNPPKELIEDTYFRHGEFIISEVKDFYIPKLKLKYSELLAKVKAKCVSVYETNPEENLLNYIAVESKGNRFLQILTKLYKDRYTFNDGKIVQIDEIYNNLPDYTYLEEVKNDDKLGRWFVMTNKISNHYLKHNFNSGDTITLSYLTGSDLANREKEKIYSYSEDVRSTDNGKLYPLGNITKNSEVAVSIYLNELEGVKLHADKGHFNFRPRRCRNCTGTNWSVSSKFQVNTFKDFKKDWDLVDVSEASKHLKVLINNTELDMDKLIEENRAVVHWVNDEKGRYIHIELKNLSEVEVIKAGQENIAYLKLEPLEVGHDSQGLKLTHITGHNIDLNGNAYAITLQQADKRRIPVATTSWGFKNWEDRVFWGKKSPSGYVPSKGKTVKHWTGSIVDIVSTITNNYN